MRLYNKNKLQLRSAKCVYLGLSPYHKGYKCLSSEGKVYVLKDVIFNQTKFPYPYIIHLTSNINTSGFVKSSQLTIIPTTQLPLFINQNSTLRFDPTINHEQSTQLNFANHTNTWQVDFNCNPLHAIEYLTCMPLL